MGTKVFVDTHALVATLNADDAHHQEVNRVFAEVSDARVQVFTSDWVLAEFLSVAARRSWRVAAMNIVADLSKAECVTIVPAERSTWDKSFRLFRSRPDKEWSLIDCTTMIICQQLRIRDVLSNDHHFEQAGFCLLL